MRILINASNIKQRNFLVIILLSAVSFNIHAQNYNFANRLENTTNNITGAIQSVVTWYDIPIGAAHLYRNHFNKTFHLLPTSFDDEIAEDFGKHGYASFGSMDKDIIPNTILMSRFAVTTGLNLFTNTNITQKDYRNIFLFQKSLMYTHTLTEIVKNLVRRERPDGSDTRSFFSGHSSTTFAAATFLYLELNDFYNDWDVTDNNAFLRNAFKTASFSVLYGWAGYVGYSRIHDKKHYLSDVLVGAAVGTLISVLVYDNYVNEKLSFLDKFSFKSTGKSLGLNFNVRF